MKTLESKIIGNQYEISPSVYHHTIENHIYSKNCISQDKIESNQAEVLALKQEKIILEIKENSRKIKEFRDKQLKENLKIKLKTLNELKYMESQQNIKKSYSKEKQEKFNENLRKKIFDKNTNKELMEKNINYIPQYKNQDEKKEIFYHTIRINENGEVKSNMKPYLQEENFYDENLYEKNDIIKIEEGENLNPIEILENENNNYINYDLYNNSFNIFQENKKFININNEFNNENNFLEQILEKKNVVDYNKKNNFVVNIRDEMIEKIKQKFKEGNNKFNKNYKSEEEKIKDFLVNSKLTFGDNFPQDINYSDKISSGIYNQTNSFSYKNNRKNESFRLTMNNYRELDINKVLNKKINLIKNLRKTGNLNEINFDNSFKTEKITENNCEDKNYNNIAIENKQRELLRSKSSMINMKSKTFCDSKSFIKR